MDQSRLAAHTAMERIAEGYDWNAGEVLLPHTMARGYFFYPEERRVDSDKHYRTNSEFWNEALRDRVIAERTVFLNEFKIFEWIPRNPGLYHTEQAEQERQWAQRSIVELGQARSEALARQMHSFWPDSRSPDHAELFRGITQAGGSARRLIYTPPGKVSMLAGGVGCVRLAPVEMKKGGLCWFMAATSTKAPDEGIPLLVRDEIYQSVIDEIRSLGFAHRTVVGKTKFVQQEFKDLYSLRHGIPRVYLEVSKVICEGECQNTDAEVSVAASFLSEYEGYPKIYASYVTFNPAAERALQSAAQWMVEEYVEGLYEGSVLTDFDQQAPTIAGTLFSLNQVLTSSDLAKQIKLLRMKYGYFEWELLEKSTISFHTHEEKVMVDVNVIGHGNVIQIAKYIKDVSIKARTNIGQSGVSEDLKNLMEHLVKQISEAGPTVDPRMAEKMGKNLELLSSELKSAQPDRRWYEVSLAGLKEAAEAVGDVGKPILTTVAKLMPLLIPQ